MLKAETWARGWLNSMHSFLCLGCLPEICFCVGRPKTISDLLFRPADTKADFR